MPIPPTGDVLSKARQLSGQIEEQIFVSHPGKKAYRSGISGAIVAITKSTTQGQEYVPPMTKAAAGRHVEIVSHTTSATPASTPEPTVSEKVPPMIAFPTVCASDCQPGIKLTPTADVINVHSALPGVACTEELDSLTDTVLPPPPPMVMSFASFKKKPALSNDSHSKFQGKELQSTSRHSDSEQSSHKSSHHRDSKRRHPGKSSRHQSHRAERHSDERGQQQKKRRLH
jgi:hypothetical protein